MPIPYSSTLAIPDCGKASGPVVYFHPTSHVGLSAHLKKNFGPYHTLNGILGVPVVLVDKKAEVPFSKIAF